MRETRVPPNAPRVSPECPGVPGPPIEASRLFGETHCRRR